MRAVALNYSTRALELLDVPEPAASGSVVIQIYEGGICGTDRELAAFRFGYPPPGCDYLILGHEAIGQVIDPGGASNLEKGDWVAPMVRRPCSPACSSCRRNRRDLCISGKYSERGIFGAHGYLTAVAVDSPENLVRIDPSLIDCAVLIEPLSVVEKAVETALRLHPGEPASALVLGAGTIGTLSALLLQKRGLQVTVHSLEDPRSPRIRSIEAAGPRYLPQLDGTYDIILEAAGSDEKAGQAAAHLAPLGVMVLLGAKQSAAPLDFLGLIVNNQTITGSVNAGPAHFLQAAAEIGSLDGQLLRGMLHRVPLESFRDSILGRVSDKPKIVHMLQ